MGGNGVSSSRSPIHVQLIQTSGGGGGGKGEWLAKTDRKLKNLNGHDTVE